VPDIAFFNFHFDSFPDFPTIRDTQNQPRETNKTSSESARPQLSSNAVNSPILFIVTHPMNVQPKKISGRARHGSMEKLDVR
jgi:hypothetical protein